MSARDSACARLVAVRHALSAFGLHDQPLVPGNQEHNTSVHIIRNGLAVQCFNILEDFIKARTVEALANISASPVLFRHLPEALQRAVTVGTIPAIVFQMRQRDKLAQVGYAQQYGAMIASTGTQPRTMPDIAFFHANSNIAKDHFRDALSAFGVVQPWTQLSGLSSRSGLSGLPAENVFLSLARRRHQAAHDAASAVSEADLKQSLSDAFALAVCFDILLSKATRQLVRLTAAAPPTFFTINDHKAIPLRFIKAVGTRFVEVKEGGRRSTRSDTAVAALLPGASSRASREDGALIVYNGSGGVTHWAV